MARVGERRVVYRTLVGRPGGKRPHGRFRRRLETSIKMYLQEITCRECTGFIWLTAEKTGGLLLTRSWKFGFHKMQNFV